MLLKPNLQLPFANANLIDASQTPNCCQMSMRTHMCIHPSVPRYIGIDINHSKPLDAHPHSVPDPVILFLLTLQWRLPVQLQAWSTCPAQYYHSDCGGNPC